MLTLEAGGQKIPQNWIWKTEYEKQNMKNQTIFELYTDDNISYQNILATLWKFLNLKKKKKKRKKKWKWNSTSSDFHSCYYWICLENS